MRKRRVISLLLAMTLSLSCMMPGIGAYANEGIETEANTDNSISGEVQSGNSEFKDMLESKYIDPDRIYSTEVRWWLNRAALTDETLLDEIQAIYDAGFRGIELCMQSGSTGSLSANEMNEIYAYGSAEWSHKWKLMMHKILDLGMTVSLTSGTHWATSNVPGLDPNSQAAMQVAAMSQTPATVTGGAEFNGTLPYPQTRRTVPGSDPVEYAANFIGAYAYKESAQNVIVYDSVIDLTEFVTDGADVYTKNVTWTPPDNDTWRIYGLWYHGNYHNSSPAMGGTSYATNYFDVRGVGALREFWEEHYLDDPELNQKILEGDVQLFMDSMEINATGGITQWAEDFPELFLEKKGYDIRPYLLLLGNLGASHNAWSQTYRPMSDLLTYRIEGDTDNELLYKIVFDYQDFLTTVFCERMFDPLREWLNEVGIKTRAQISYGRPFEMSEPIMHVDYPETENRVMYNQADMWRFWTGGSKLQNKVLSSETSAHSNSGYLFTNQIHLRDAYNQFASGIQRTIWHIWSADYDYGETPATYTGGIQGWPVQGAGGSGFYKFGTREPSSRDYDEFNAHLGRVQQLMQTGKSRTDIGFIQNKWFQFMLDFGEAPNGNQTGPLEIDTPANMNRMNYQLAHQGIFYRSTELQDNGYTYDYFSPKFLKEDGVYYDKDTGTIEPAGYKALVLWQEWLDAEAAAIILELAAEGLPVVILDGAASYTPFRDGKEESLRERINQLKGLSTVRTATVAGLTNDDYATYFTATPVGYEDNVLELLQELGVYPYAEYMEPNHQLLTQSRVDEDGNMYLYAYNYCPDTYHQYSHIDSVKTESHGTNIQTEIKMDGRFIPYSIDAWTGNVTELGNYRWENGQTVFPIDLDFDNIALFAFESVDDEKLHIVSTNAASSYMTENGLIIRATETGQYDAALSNGASYTNYIEVPEAYDITDWDLTVESWTAGNEILTREEPRVLNPEETTVNSKYVTRKTPIDVQLDTLTTWDSIPEVGRDVSGTGHYQTTFIWDASTADGAYLDLGDTLVQSMKVWINGNKVGGSISANPTKEKRSVGVEIDGIVPDGKDQYTGGVNLMKPVADISAYLVDGENEIVIEYSSNLTNVQLSRGVVSPRQAIYGWFNYVGGYFGYGPSQAVIVPFVEETVPEQGNRGLKLSTDAYHVEAGDYANITTEFAEPVNSNTAILHYYYNTELFEQRDFHPGDSVRVISRATTDYGAKVVVMVADYNTRTYGRLALQAKPDAILSTGRTTVRAEAEYVFLDDEGEKTIEIATGSMSFTIYGKGNPVDPERPLPRVKGDTNGDDIVDLIDLSNMIDWFGIDSSNAEWNDWYIYFDFNNNCGIDIYDISTVAQLIK